MRSAGVSVEQGPMRLVIPHTIALRPEVAALGIGMGAEFYDLTSDDQGYFHLFDRLWSEGRGFINVEQDVLPSIELVEALWGCPQELCSGYYMQADDRVRYTLACVKFSTALIARLPNAMKDAITRCPTMRWTMLDLALVNPTGVLAQGGAVTHIHEPAMLHLHGARWPQ
jgi:hypothetical protein